MADLTLTLSLSEALALRTAVEARISVLNAAGEACTVATLSGVRETLENVIEADLERRARRARVDATDRLNDLLVRDLGNAMNAAQEARQSERPQRKEQDDDDFECFAGHKGCKITNQNYPNGRKIVLLILLIY